ncbi:hypothetical protein [Rhodococcus sp. ACS1]|uniref:hypothetical protein n=1 Tax=Rhodococcus sp. ACS1 TaxID=2028570 RepID=UPI00117A82E8|nr:hypothetical protein [Rhodococcus sp. ACS1]
MDAAEHRGTPMPDFEPTHLDSEATMFSIGNFDIYDGGAAIFVSSEDREGKHVTFTLLADEALRLEKFIADRHDRFVKEATKPVGRSPLSDPVSIVEPHSGPQEVPWNPNVPSEDPADPTGSATAPSA